jgi:hypothetical protein
MKKSMALMFCGFLTLLLTACGSSGGGGGASTSGPTAPLVKAVGYLVTANGTPYTYTGPLTSTAVSATGGPASGGGNTASASLPTNGMLSCSNAIVNTTTVPGKFLFYAFFIAENAGEAYVYTYELDPTNGSLSLIGTQSWANPSNSCPSNGGPVLAAQKKCLFLSSTQAVPINSDGTVGSIVNPGEANPGNIEYLLSTDSTGNFLLANVITQSGSCTPTTCLIYSYKINSNCAISSANVGQVSVPNPPAYGYILPKYNTLLVFDSYESQVEQYIVSNTGTLTAGGTLPVANGMTVAPMFVSPDDNELYISEYGSNQSFLYDYSVLPATGGGVSLTLQNYLSESVGGGTGAQMVENVAPGSTTNGTYLFTAGFPLISIGSGGVLTEISNTSGMGGGVYIPAQ